jgi:predicted Rossmann fold flavoprotein
MYADGELFHEEAGQLQLTKDGISGIPVFNGSGRAALALAAGRNVTAEADFFPDMEEAVFISYLKDRFLRLSRRTDAEKLKGLIPERLIPAVLMETKNAEDIALRIRHFPMTVTGSKGPSAAQVMSGGVDTAEVDPSTMESRLVRGLYFAGEILDIDGNCGGYNLMFAFAGGALAGKAQGDCT